MLSRAVGSSRPCRAGYLPAGNGLAQPGTTIAYISLLKYAALQQGPRVRRASSTTLSDHDFTLLLEQNGQCNPRAGDGRRAEGQFRPSRHADGHGGDRRRAVEPVITATIRPIRTGSTATASCCRTATARCCMYALLHLTGYDLPMDEIRNFRQLHSKTPGHPGSRHHAGRRNHHRPAGPGPRQRGRHGAGRKAAGRANSTGPASTSSTTTPTCSSATAA